MLVLAKIFRNCIVAMILKILEILDTELIYTYINRKIIAEQVYAMNYLEIWFVILKY